MALSRLRISGHGREVISAVKSLVDVEEELDRKRYTAEFKAEPYDYWMVAEIHGG